MQPPTFAGNSGVGYVVTAGGDLVRFNLNNPSGGASAVFSDQQVLAAQALPSGQVVAALANGIVDILAPQGNGLGVASELLATGGTPTLPSAIDVVEKPNGLFNVLVSSQGSDTIFVFDTAAAAGTPSTGGASLPTLNAFQPTTVSSTQVVVFAATANASSASQASVSATSSASANSGAVSVSTGTTAGLSLGNLSSLGNSLGKGTTDAVLVSIEGNTYLSVPVLGIGSENAEEAGAGEGRMPWLSTMLPFGDTSPLTRFVIGIDEDALQRLSRRTKDRRDSRSGTRAPPTILGTRISFFGVCGSNHQSSVRKGMARRRKGTAPRPCSLSSRSEPA